MFDHRMYGLKAVPFKEANFSATCFAPEVVASATPQPGRTGIGFLFLWSELTPNMPPFEIPQLKDYSPGALDTFCGEILAQFDQDAAAATTVEAVEQLRIRWIGRKQGLLTRISE